MATTEIGIEYFRPGDGAIPASGVDATSGLAYSAWEVDDEGIFSFRVPDSFASGVDLSVILAWSSASTSKNHQWAITATLMRPGTTATDAETWEESLTYSDNTSPSTANQLTETTLTICSDGEIDDEEIDPGDVVSIALSRVAADASEDSAVIRVFSCTVVIDGTAAAPAGYSGSRLEEIDLRCRMLMNDDNSYFRSQAQFLLAVNSCLKRIAAEGYWKKETTIDATTSTEYTLRTLVSDIVTLYRVRWYEDDSYSIMKRLSSWHEYRNTVDYDTYGYGRPIYWFQSGPTLWLHPAAETATTDGLILFHSYQPTALDYDTQFTPDFPAAMDDVIVYFVMWWLAERDFTRPGATPQAAQAWRVQFESELSRLLAIPGLSAKPSR